MKVIHLISGGDTGGAKTHVHMLLQNLSRNIQVTMVCFTDGPFAQEARDLGIETVIFPGNNLLRVCRALRRFILDGGYDLIHCHGARGNLMGALLRRSTHLPVVSTVHSDPKLDYLGRPLARMTYGLANAWALKHLDYRIGVSDAMTDLLISRGFDPNHLFTIYNGLDFSPRPPALDRRAYLDSLGLSWGEDCVIAGIAARLNPVKDISTLIRGFAMAHATCPHLRLLIAGDGEEEAKLKTLTAELGLTGEICFAGWVTDTDSFYNALDINTLTSLSETFPYALTEGARAGLPTVASRVGGVPYLIDHGVNGFLFPPGDAQSLARHLAALAGDPLLRAHMGQRLREKGVSQFSLQSTLERQLDIYRSILRRQARKAGKRDGILICGAYGRGNAGDDAILEAIVQEMRGLDPDMPLWVLSRKPAETRLIYRVGSIYTFNFPRFLRRMTKTKLYINGGGSLMQDATSRRRSLLYYLFTLSAGKLLGNKVIMYGCGIGPLQYPSNRRLAGKIIQRRVDVITLRDAHSQKELERMGVTKPRIILSADPTVTLPAAEGHTVDGLLESAGLDPQGKYIAFTLRPWPGFEAKAPILAKGADYAYSKYGLTPLFLPIERRLDVDACQQVIRLTKAPARLLDVAASSSQTIGLYARMQMVVSMRLHALVFAAGQGVPLVGVVYDPKVSSFLSYIGQDLYTDLADLTEDGLRALIDGAAGRIGDTAFLTGGVERLRAIEGRNQAAAAELLGIERREEA